jgi:hypothetical protein
MPLEQTRLQQSVAVVQLSPSSAQQAGPPSAKSVRQSSPAQHEPGAQALPIHGQHAPQRQFSPAAQLAAQPVPTVGQQTPALQLPWQQSVFAWQEIPAAAQLPAAVLGLRPPPRAPPPMQAARVTLKAAAKAACSTGTF